MSTSQIHGVSLGVQWGGCLFICFFSLSFFQLTQASCALPQAKVGKISPYQFKFSLTGVTVSVCGVGDVPGLPHLVGSALTQDFSAASGDFNFAAARTRLNQINPEN